MTNQIEVRHLRYFMELSRSLHYRKAAEKLFISQSALSQQIKQLETSLGVELFDRTNRRVSLTTYGHELIPRAKEICTLLDLTINHFRLSKQGILGEIRIGFVGSAMQSFLPLVLQTFHKDHPQIRFFLEELPNTQQLEFLKSDQIDIGFVRTNQVTEDMNIKRISQEAFTLVLPQDHPLVDKKQCDISVLAKEQFILYPSTRSTRYYDQIIAMCADHGFSPKIAHRAVHVPTIFRLVEAGMGISMIPSSFTDTLNYNVHLVKLDHLEHTTELFAVWKKKNSNISLKHFLELL